ncbi:hypothetical protein BJV78DRAFT_1156791 [Lactifluus subvellereus]|nr:hypothetical protein BJV78DRAFT_1156791 [Lactifluus subvellereus]
MFSLLRSVTAAAIAVSLSGPAVVHAWSRCRNQPGDPGYPTTADWSALNDTIYGRLVGVVPSVKACLELGCTEAQWESGIFRQKIPGSMNAVGTGGSSSAVLPILSSKVHVCDRITALQLNSAFVMGLLVHREMSHFMQSMPQPFNIFRLALDLPKITTCVLLSNHPAMVTLGRSTARNSLLWTAYFKNITFAEEFPTAGADQGPVVTVGSGVGLKTIYAAAKAQNKMFVGGSAVTVSAAGGYTQGAGHSAFSPIYGLAADNVLHSSKPLEYRVVLANGSFVTANSVSHPDLFWALRGGGAGSWGVIIDATLRTFPIFNATLHTVNVLTATLDQTVNLMALRTSRTGMRSGLGRSTSTSNSTLVVTTYFKDLDGDASKAQMSSFLDDARALGAVVQEESTVTAPANDLVEFPDDQSGFNVVISSRLVPNSVYLNAPSNISTAYKWLLSLGVPAALGHLVAGGQVAANANISSAINPAWRSAKTHVIGVQLWNDTLSVDDVQALRRNFTATVQPVLAELAGGASSGSYSNEGDVLEPNFSVTFYGPNYSCLESIKAAYDPNDFFYRSDWSP